MSNSPQEVQLELLRITKSNELDGERVAADLRQHSELWKAVALHQPEDIGVTLVYLTSGDVAADAIYILSSGRDDEALLRLADGWSSSGITWEDEIVAPSEGRVLRAWWD
jgi:hypothetical protein